MSMSHKTQAFCKASIANRINFHNNTRLVGNDIHNQPRNYKNGWSFTGRTVMRKVVGPEVFYDFEVYSYDRRIAYYSAEREVWIVDPESRGISQTTNSHFDLVMQVIRDSYGDNYELLAFNDPNTFKAD